MSRLSLDRIDIAIGPFNVRIDEETIEESDAQDESLLL